MLTLWARGKKREKLSSKNNVTEYIYTKTEVRMNIFLNQISTTNKHVSIKRNQFTDIITT